MRPNDTSTGRADGSRSAGHPTPRYEIRVAGRLEDRWTAWFDGLALTARDDGTTVIRGPVVDQAALHGVLQRLRDLGIPLVSLVRLPDRPEQPDLPDDPSPDKPAGATP